MHTVAVCTVHAAALCSTLSGRTPHYSRAYGSMVDVEGVITSHRVEQNPKTSKNR